MAEKNAEAVKIEGQAESELTKVLGLRRYYEYLNSKLEIIKQMAGNKNLKIFGNTDDSALSQMAAYGLLGKKQVWDDLIWRGNKIITDFYLNH